MIVVPMNEVECSGLKINFVVSVKKKLARCDGVP